MTIESLRRLNSYEESGSFGRSSLALDDLVIEHLQLVREMSELKPRERIAVRMAVEGYTHREIATRSGVCVRTAIRTILRLVAA
jgi:DNA-directed RNA polymerase specialized sigma24 family protein